MIKHYRARQHSVHSDGRLQLVAQLNGPKRVNTRIHQRCVCVHHASGYDVY